MTNLSTADCFAILMAKCPNARDLLETLKNIECYPNSPDEVEIYASILPEEAEKAMEQYLSEQDQPCAMTRAHERQELGL